MTFGDAISSVLTKNYANFSGRARRSEYWYFYLFSFLVNIVTNIIDRAVGTPIIGGLVALALIVPELAVGVRRLHDIGRSGWWLLIVFTIVGIVVLIVWFCQDSQPDNKYGPSPKSATGVLGSSGPSPYGA